MRDRHGKKIKVGDVVLRRITVNHDQFKGFTFTTMIVKRQDGVKILDGVYSYAYLDECESRDLVKVTPETDLRSVEIDFIQENRSASQVSVG